MNTFQQSVLVPGCVEGLPGSRRWCGGSGGGPPPRTAPGRSGGGPPLWPAPSGSRRRGQEEEEGAGRVVKEGTGGFCVDGSVKKEGADGRWERRKGCAGFGEDADAESKDEDAGGNEKR
ncbi:hypothetical protein SEVIR_8G124750v4 [Setaria viridis]